MATVGKLVSRLLPSTANTVLYTCPSLATVSISSLSLCNVTTSVVTVRVFHATATEVAGTSTAIVFDLFIRPNSTTILEIGMKLKQGEQLVAQCSTASAMCVVVYGAAE